MARDRAGNSARRARNVTLRGGANVFRDAVSRSDKHDFYRFRLGRSSRLAVSLSNLSANADVTLLDRTRAVVGRSRRRGKRSERITTNLESGTYFVRVSRRRGSTRYKLKLVSSGQTAPSAAPLTPAVQPAAPPRPASNASTSLNPLARGVLSLTNAVRQNAGLAPLQLNETLSTVAQSHSQNMAINDFFDHVDPSGDRSPQRVAAANYGYRATAENIGAGYRTAEGVVNAWLKSPSHSANIFNPALTEIGIGYYSLPNDTGSINYNHYWTQVFATPLS